MCVGVCALTCINVPVFVGIEDISLNPEKKEINPHRETRLAKATDRQHVGAASFLFWQHCIFGCCCASAKSCRMQPWKFLSKAAKRTCNLKDIYIHICLTSLVVYNKIVLHHDHHRRKRLTDIGQSVKT